MISFKNTERGFSGKSNSELRKARRLYRILRIRSWYAIWKGMMEVSIRLKIPMGWVVKPLCFKQLYGGNSLEESISTIVTLSKFRVKSILSYYEGGKRSPELIRQTMEETIRRIEIPACCADVTFAVFKPSMLCPEDILKRLNSRKSLSDNILKDANDFHECVEELCWKAYEKNIPIIVDAEYFAFQNFIDDTVTEMMEKFNREKVIVYNTLQMYRTDRLEYLSSCYNRAEQKGYRLGLKIVRGAYLEKERARAFEIGISSPVWQDKGNTDRAYNQALGFCIYHIDKISILAATHNEESCIFLTELMKTNGIEKNDPRVYFSQFYGMSDHITFTLAAEGYNVAKYIPYGPVNKTLPYLIQRIQDNSYFADLTSRELRVLSTELKRRRKVK
jgi:proline dehydrogenase